MRLRRIGLAVCALAMSLSAYAQNPLQVDPAHFRVEYEDERVRVIRFRLAPGEKSPLHEHNTRIAVVVSGSRLKIEDTEGASHEITVNSGQAERQLAIRHSVENVGDQVYEELTTEFKDAASQPPKLIAKVVPPPLKAEKPKEEKPKEERTKEEKPKKEKKQDNKDGKAAPAKVENAATAPSTAAPAAAPPKDAKDAPAQAEVAKAMPPPEKVEPPPPLVPEPIIKPLKKRTAYEPTLGRRARKAFEAEELSEANVNNTHLAFMEQGKGVPVVFVHGAMGDYRTWQTQIPVVAKSYRVISYSRRYHFPNPSTGKEEDYTYAANVKDLAEFLAALKLGPVHLVGHGYGAAVATLLAKEHPELVRSLTLSEPGFDNLLDEKRAYRSHWARDEVYNIIRKPLSKANPEKGVQVYHDWLAETEPWSRLDPQEQYERKQNANALRAQSVDPAAPAITCADAKQIQVPALVIAGQNRSPNSAEITGTLAACLPKSERATISNTGPAAYLDNAAEYNDVLLKFLGKH
jgi:non-heme chloroperoxidase